ncbi:receptor-type tyrosine-protein phosphatase alpha [Hyalella azteca]|uniref:Receptor-type tyrosine-protein phosphatase alpha n=1 Tax=Hyalella azteca TaxID=294128 RepID=A0A8B7PAU2_HYAAZ|nr:receptor-type tyrosine-protein phosphatase alpha [Hyalella azteca]
MSARLKHEEEFVLENLDRPIIAGSSGMAAGATVGIAIGVLVILALVVLLLVHRRLQSNHPKQHGILAPSKPAEQAPPTRPDAVKPEKGQSQVGKLVSRLRNIPAIAEDSTKAKIITENEPLSKTNKKGNQKQNDEANHSDLPGVIALPVLKPAQRAPALQQSDVRKSVLQPAKPVKPENHTKIAQPAQQFPLQRETASWKPVSAVKPLVLSAEPDAIYVNEESTAAPDAGAVRLQDMEAFLNKNIGSSELTQEFSSMPTNFGFPMTDGELPANRHKNRYRNNLPYNETRVRLKVINNDPNSDYINANVVKGAVSNRRYIASQGPKDENECTISDFWRMIVEQEVNVIIMVANFVEKNVDKVGKYFSYDGQVSLPDLDGTVTILTTKTTSYCTISRLQVELVLDGVAVVRRVTHYHYTKWPDHGVPTETLTLSSMLREIATSHYNIHAVVHCSAGIGRTGTVLFDLICYDHLQASGKVNIMAVLKDLRQSRARLVENQVQFKLSLQLLDELLFGFLTVKSTDDLEENKLPQLLEQCPGWFKRLKALPSPLTFSTASWKENAPFNRSPDVLPADSQRIFVQGPGGQQQYVNAVRLDGLQGDEAYIVTEHPLPGRLEPFWNMVLSKKTSVVMVLNAQYDENFPELFPSDGSTLTAGPVKVQAGAQLLDTPDIVGHRLTVTNGKTSASVSVYEVKGWSRGATCPPDVTAIVSLADVIRSSPSTSTGPPTLVCGDGVTACGLAAGVLSVVDRLKERQDVDVYRTAVKLRRCRSQFFVDESQLQQMLLAASTYLTNFQEYCNFK